MKKMYSLITAGLLTVISFFQLNAQCANGRYHDFIFPGNPDSTKGVTFGSNASFYNSTVNLLLDVYQPHGDTASKRALIIFTHGGSFVGGTRDQMATLCHDFSKMGYVTATIDYRLGMTHLIIGGPPDSTDAGAAVLRAVHDARAAVRFFRKDVAELGNTYKIDTNNIYFAGASAGGITGLHLAYMDELSEIPPYIDTVGQYGLHGGVEGQSGNEGYSSKVKAVVSLSGAIADTSWMKAGDIPVISTHSLLDATVPYDKRLIYLQPPNNMPIQVICGSSIVTERANQVGIENCFKTYQGNHHVPETSSIDIYDTSLVLVRNFLEHLTCGVALDCNYTSFPLVGVATIAAPDLMFTVYPNPATNALTVDLSAFAGESVSVELYDALGRKVQEITKIKTDKQVVNRGSLPNGIYLLNVIGDGKLYSKKVLFE
jgi:hypothetical protein